MKRLPAMQIYDTAPYVVTANYIAWGDACEPFGEAHLVESGCNDSYKESVWMGVDERGRVVSMWDGWTDPDIDATLDMLDAPSKLLLMALRADPD